MNHDIISTIDTAIGCQQCEGSLDASPSDDFCSDRCQATWSAARVQPLTSYSEPDEQPAHVANLVELHSPETCVACMEGRHRRGAIDAALAAALASGSSHVLVGVDPAGRSDDIAVLVPSRNALRANPEWLDQTAFVHDWERRRREDARRLYLNGRVAGVTPDGEVIARDSSGQPVVVAHVAQRPGEVVRHTDIQTERHQFSPGAGRRIADQLHTAISANVVPTGERVRAFERAVERLARQAGVSVAQLGAGIPVVPFGWTASIAETALRAAQAQERWAALWEETARAASRLMDDHASPEPGRLGGLTFECVGYDPAAVARLFLNDVVRPESTPDPRRRALELRRNRSTGPAASARAPRTINPSRRSR